MFLAEYAFGSFLVCGPKANMRPRSRGTLSQDGNKCYSQLTREELQRMHASLYGHRSSLREKTVAHAVTSKAASSVIRASVCDRSRARLHATTIPPPADEGNRPDVENGASQPVKRPPIPFAGNRSSFTTASERNASSCKAAPSTLSREVWNRLTAPPQTLSAEMQAWAQEMGTDFSFPLQIADIRRGFLRQPLLASSQEKWKRACEAGDVRVMNSLRACVVHSSASGGRPRSSAKQRACWCTAKSQPNQKLNDDESMDNERPAAPNRLDKINAALAHWKLNRVIEQGSAYLYHVCPGSKNRATALATDLGGLYVIPDGSFVDDVVEQIKKQRSKLRLIKTLNHQLNGDHDKEAENQEEDDDLADDDAPDYSKEEGEYVDGRVRESSDLFPFPSVEVTLKDSNLLCLKVHMSDAQVRFLLRGAKEEDPGSRSTFAFDAEAVCVGEDCWFMITGMWKKRLVWVLRDARNPAVIDSLIIDGICWEKRRFDDGAKATDPFQCVQCGNVRRSDNVSYSSRNTSTIRRGKYRCLICGIPTIHVSMRGDAFRPRPRWDPTSGHPLAADLCMSSKEVEAPGPAATRR